MLQDTIEQDINISQHSLARYASQPHKSRGRLYKEDESQTRSPFRRDCDRIIHSNAFRRLEYKTQVFVNHEGDHYRTRLTHSLEVAQIARSISRNLCLCEDLAEALALAHDLGHTPFGHAGEDALNEAAHKLYKFDHNAQSLKILTQLEKKYADFDGLNLSWETLEGIAKHNGPIIGVNRDKKRYDGTIPRTIKIYNDNHDLKLDTFPSAEAQISALADDIAYNNHDIEDGVRAGLLKLNELRELSFLKEIFEQVEEQYDELEQGRKLHEVTRRMINRMVVDLITQSINNIEKNNIETADDIRQLGKPLIHFSDEMNERRKEMNKYLMDNMYRHYKVCRTTSKARNIVKDLFVRFYNEPECLPTGWRNKTNGKSDEERAEIVVDFVAGMTDRFAIEEHKRLNIMEYK